MAELSEKAAAWLQSVMDRLPISIRAIYVEYTDTFSPSMEHSVSFNAFGFEDLAGGQFDPSNADHVSELGEFTWEPPDECTFRAIDHAGTNWLAVLWAAASSPEVVSLASDHGIQFIVGEHDGDVYVIR